MNEKIENKHIRKIKNMREMWNVLAITNPKFFIYSDKGEDVKDEKFRQSGLDDYNRFIALDGLLNLKKEYKVLEIGCGNGRMSEYIASYFDEIYCVDVSDTYIEQAKNRLSNISNIHWESTDGETYPYSAEYFNFIFSYTVFQHIDSKTIIRRNFEEIARVLKRGGVAKIQLRGKETEEDKWFSGVAFTTDDMINKLLENLSLKLIKKEQGDKEYIWFWLEKI